ncbi:MAG: CBS domain-containing protein [Candidatus Omnitrophica bacterium]|nr:CBS domain-containing protein [Candidatus Omnitrophota bacterium]
MSDDQLNLDQILAKDIMSESVISVKPDMLIGQVAHLMLRSIVSGVPVVNENKELVGIVTLTDLFILLDKVARQVEQGVNDERNKSLHEHLEKTKNLPILEIMSKTIITIAPTTTLREMLDIVIKWHIHFLPVMQEGKIIGVIGRHDILNATYVYG